MTNNKTIAVAESVTAGGIQTMLSLAPNATCFFEGGVTAYNLEKKVALLGIDKVHGERCNCVSSTVAAQMARGVSKLFKSDYGVGITGYASPVPEEGIDCLFAFYAISFKGHVGCKGKLTTTKDSPDKAQEDYANQILKVVETFLAGKH